MKINELKIWLWLIVIPGILLAQNQIKTGVIANGGGTTENESYKINGTVGQALAGMAANSNNTIRSGFWNQITDISTSIVVSDEEADLAREFDLEQNYPNPFNPATTIKFSISEEAEVTIKIFDLLGREQALIVQDKFAQGKYNVVFEAAELPSGMYFYRISAKATQSGERFVNTRKLTLLK